MHPTLQSRGVPETFWNCETEAEIHLFNQQKMFTDAQILPPTVLAIQLQLVLDVIVSENTSLINQIKCEDWIGCLIKTKTKNKKLN